MLAERLLGVHRADRGLFLTIAARIAHLVDHVLDIDGRRRTEPATCSS
jgi:hypothetical protein